jgi:hypothetical protein
VLRIEERIASDWNFGIGPAISPSRMPMSPRAHECDHWSVDSGFVRLQPIPNGVALVGEIHHLGQRVEWLVRMRNEAARCPNGKAPAHRS